MRVLNERKALILELVGEEARQQTGFPGCVSIVTALTLLSETRVTVWTMGGSQTPAQLQTRHSRVLSD